MYVLSMYTQTHFTQLVPDSAWFICRRELGYGYHRHGRGYHFQKAFWERKREARRERKKAQARLLLLQNILCKKEIASLF